MGRAQSKRCKHFGHRGAVRLARMSRAGDDNAEIEKSQAETPRKSNRNVGEQSRRRLV